MFKQSFGIAAVLVTVLMAFSCVSTKYYGPTDYINFRSTDKIKRSSQTSVLKEDSGLVSTYDDEYTYDDKGNVIKIKQTEYIDRLAKDKKFITWETEWKVIGGNPVPYRVSANGVPFIEIDYELLTAAGNGAVVEDITERAFLRVVSDFLSGTDIEPWSIALSNYNVPFKVDSKFVKEARRFNIYDGQYTENVLTLGYDNIVLKRFHYSKEKLAQGLGNSYTGYNYYSEMAKKLTTGINVDYTYEWKAIADRICQTKMTYSSLSLKLDATEEYDATGKRIKESWVVVDPRVKDQKPMKIFEQSLTY
jgi:hypothetical protein